MYNQGAFLKSNNISPNSYPVPLSILSISHEQEEINHLIYALAKIESTFNNPIPFRFIAGHIEKREERGKADFKKKEYVLEKSVAILVVDDNEDFNEAICNRLKRIPRVQVETCLMGEDAVKKVYAMNYDLILLDILLKDTDGITVFEKMRKLRPSLPIVLMSAYSHVDKVQKARKLPAITFLEKPFEFDLLRDMILLIQKGKE